MIVADTNLIAYLLIDGDQTALAARVLEKDPVWIAPLLWRSELRNVLCRTVRLEHISLQHALHVMGTAERLLRENEFCVSSDAVLPLARRSGCSAYDCEFVALARQTGAPLVTADRKVLAAFPGVALSPTNFLF